MSGTMVRPAAFARRGERSWIIKSWLACDRASLAARHRPDYLKAKGAEIEQLLSTCSTLVTCSAENPDALIGFVVFEPATSVLHYVYVRKADQSLGFARELVQATGLLPGHSVRCTHRPVGSGYGRNLPDGWTYSPETQGKDSCASAT